MLAVVHSASGNNLISGNRSADKIGDSRQKGDRESKQAQDRREKYSSIKLDSIKYSGPLGLSAVGNEKTRLIDEVR